MAKRDRAAYMRDYRAKQRAAFENYVAEPDGPSGEEKIRALEEEVARLKRELAARSPIPGHAFNSRPFTPVPKK